MCVRTRFSFPPVLIPFVAMAISHLGMCTSSLQNPRQETGNHLPADRKCSVSKSYKLFSYLSQLCVCVCGTPSKQERAISTTPSLTLCEVSVCLLQIGMIARLLCNMAAAAVCVTAGRQLSVQSFAVECENVENRGAGPPSSVPECVY